MNLSGLIDNLATGISDHMPDILLGTSLAAGTAATIYGIAVTPKAMDEILAWVMENTTEKERRGLKLSELPKLVPFKMKVKLLWRMYLPVAVGTATSVGTGLASNKMHNDRTMSATALASSLSTRLADLQASTKEVVGATRYDEIEAKAAQKAVDRDHEREEPERVYRFNKKTDGFKVKDDINGATYILDREMLTDVQTSLNNKIRVYDRVTYNEFLSELRDRGADIPLSSIGLNFGWDIADGYIHFVEDMRGGLDDGVPVGVLHLADQMSIFVNSRERIRFR